MGSRFVEKIMPSTGDSGPFQSPEKPILAWFQFVPALVTDVIINPFNVNYESDQDLYAILVKPHEKDAFGGSMNVDAFSAEKYYPLLRGTIDPPIRGEQVLVCTFGGINYYMGPINTLNLPNFNPDTLKSSHINLKNKNKEKVSDKFGISKNFPMTETSRLTKPSNRSLDGVNVNEPGDIHGDMLLEGRHGSSIRIGSRYKNPYIFIKNSLNPDDSQESPHAGSLFGMSSIGSISQLYPQIDDRNAELVRSFVLPSDLVENNNRTIGGDIFNYEYSDNQILQTSDKITICSNSDSIFLSSFQNIIIGAGNNLQIISNNETIIESSNIYLGREALNKEQPMVLGTSLTEILSEIVTILQSFKVTGCVAGMSGPPEPVTLQKLINLDTQIQGLQHLSEYHFIENNGQKAD